MVQDFVLSVVAERCQNSWGMFPKPHGIVNPAAHDVNATEHDAHLRLR